MAPSFTRLGSAVRSRVDGWDDPTDVDLVGRRILVTGATSGLGRAAARRLAGAGATVVAVGRDQERLVSLRDQVGERILPERADLADLDAVRSLVERLPRVDTVLHNAGALLADRAESPQGIEVTIASQVVAPFLLTRALVERATSDARAEHGGEGAPPLRVVTMSSGGMYAAPLTVDGLEMPADRYDGTRQYALAKRAQVTLNEMWAERVEAGIAWFAAAHPGWADTPGVAESLPTFRRILGPALRTPDEGADTVVWLCAEHTPPGPTGGFWHDRRRRSIHRLPGTRRSDTAERRRRLWDWVEEAAVR